MVYSFCRILYLNKRDTPNHFLSVLRKELLSEVKLKRVEFHCFGLLQLSQSEAEHKQLREEEKELLARMNVCSLKISDLMCFNY